MLRAHRFQLASSCAASFLAFTIPEAAGQVDPNLQTQIDTYAPRLSETIVPRQTTTVLTPVFQNVTEQQPLPEATRRSLLQTAMQKAGDPSLMGVAEMTPSQLSGLFSKYRIPATRTRVVRRQVGTKSTTLSVPRQVQGSISASVNYNYETNASKSNIARKADSLAVGGTSFQLSIPVGSDETEDTIGLIAGTTSLRYRSLTLRDVDFASVGASFSTTIWKTQDAPRNKTTRHILTFGLEETTSMRPTFEAATANIVAPTFAWAFDRIPLSDETCGTGAQEGFCHFATIRFIAKHNLADVATQDNTSARLEGMLGWVTPVAGLTASATAGVQANRYVHVPGGREDFTMDLLGKLDWAFAPNGVLSGTVRYVAMRSSVTRLSWDGATLSPQLKLTWRF